MSSMKATLPMMSTWAPLAAPQPSSRLAGGLCWYSLTYVVAPEGVESHFPSPPSGAHEAGAKDGHALVAIHKVDSAFQAAVPYPSDVLSMRKGMLLHLPVVAIL
ncbi:hypothetical protein NL676_004798 [Syzygium grande]|nr:hypothetical protein NL676_004798 [Syzygium grande]